MTYNDYLAHHGILGMKWGVRRYQNKDGSLTPAGEKRYAKKQFKDDVKTVRTQSYDHTFEADTTPDADGRILISNVRNESYKIGGREVTADYVEKVLKQIDKEDIRNRRLSTISQATYFAGAAAIMAMIGLSSS